MRRFFDDTSSAKMLTPELPYRYAIKHMSNMQCSGYELRKYNRDGTYEIIDNFVTRKAAEVAKSFADIELGQPTAIVAVDPFRYLRAKTELSSVYGSCVDLTDEELNYINKDKEALKSAFEFGNTHAKVRG